MNTTNLLDAIRVVKENERIASESYANAAKRINTLGKALFEKLSEFERFHYDRLAALEKSLEEKGEFINYEGKDLILPPTLEIKFTEEPDKKSMVEIISEAMKLEKQAEKAYADLAVQLTDPDGHQMFIKFAQEERKHYEILAEAYWSINQTGTWTWSNP
jgi:beta-galactosidase/beta-glucuronidase